MDKKTIEICRNILEEQLDMLTHSGHQAISGLIGQENLHADPLDRATAEINQGFMLRIKDRESRLINKIRNALKRIEDGSFGTCESCEDDIGLGRLKARPVATHCIKCKLELEMMEKRFRN